LKDFFSTGLKPSWIGDLRHVCPEIRMNISLQSFNAQEGRPACPAGWVEANRRTLTARITPAQLAAFVADIINQRGRRHLYFGQG
jgi:hypothetical protein